ncbi:hypothetical protein M9458_013563, partial [Cirrhinus mrigala]
LIPLPKLPTAMETAETLCNFVFCFYGLPEDIVSNRGPQFTSRLWSSFFSLLNVNVSLTSRSHHPQANGQTERLNQGLTRFLRTYCHNHQTDWSRYLMWAEYAQNSLVKPATGLTPFKCVLGYQPPLFPWSGEPSDLPSVNEWLQRSEETWNRAHHHLQRAVRRQEEQANRHRRPNPEYTPGQWVWLSTRDLRLRLPCKNLSPRYVGPFKILRQLTPVSFHLDLPADYRISPTFHVSVLDLTLMRAIVVPECALAIQQLAASFKMGASRPLKAFQKMLGLMASASPVLQLGLLRMRPLQHWLKPRVPSHAWRHGRLRSSPSSLEGPSVDGAGRKVVSTDASNSGWGALCDGKPAFGHWTKRE